MGERSQLCFARRVGAPGAVDMAGSCAERRAFWPLALEHLLDRPVPMLAAVFTTAVSVVVLAALAQPGATAVATEPSFKGLEHAAVVAPQVTAAPVAPATAPPPTARQRFRSLSEEAAKSCPGLPPSVLFAISEVETNHGVDRRISKAGARGPMQFKPLTWRAYAVDGDGDGRRDITNPADAVHTAARHLCMNGAADPQHLRRAVLNYNHSGAYADKVLRLAKSYSS